MEQRETGIGPDTIFNGSKLKVKRANQLIAEMSQVFDDFLHSDFYRFVVDQDANQENISLAFNSLRVPRKKLH